MSSSQQNSMENIERKRAQLEENVTKLQQALKHWQTWELEYGFFKEEIEAAGDPSSSQIEQIGRDLEGELLTAKEIQDLLGKDSKRTANTVVDMISRRIDYVQQNISTVEKQLDSIEKQLAGATVLTAPDIENEEGLPMMDIVEELDEEGNVISGEVLQPGKVAPELVEALRKTGIEKNKQADGKKSDVSNEQSSSLPPEPSTSTSANDTSSSSKGSPLKKTVSFSEDTKPEAPAKAKKSVSFSDDIVSDSTPIQNQTLEADGYNGDVSNFNFPPGTKVVEIDDDWNEIASYPVMPKDDTPEEADLRRQMINYGLSEVGNIVAEIDLEGRDEDDYDDEMDDFDEDYDSAEDEDEDEDKFGRSTKRELTDEYLKQMQALEKKLNAQMLENVGPRPDLHPLSEFADDVRSLRIRKDEEVDQLMDPKADASSEGSKKKGVRFADSLDVSEAPQPYTEPRENLPSTSTKTMSDIVVERAGPAPIPPSETPSKPAKVSRFKSARAAQSQADINTLPTPPVPEMQAFPEGPKGRTLADTVLEHNVSSSGAQPPDEFDPAMINREVQSQYHKMRNKMIQQQGGFKPTEEDIESPLVEEKDGKTKKVSRFKAARLKAEGL